VLPYGAIHMPTVLSPEHFVSLEDLPQFDGRTVFRKVFSELNRRGRSGFVVASANGVTRYVKGMELAEAAVKLAGSKHDQFLPNARADALRQVSDTAVGQVLDMEWAKSSVLVIPATPVDSSADAAPLQNAADAVFAIVQLQRPVGWFLNHEVVMQTSTGKPVFVCENGHDNPDSDHGSCYYCPGDIVSVKRV